MKLNQSLVLLLLLFVYTNTSGQKPEPAIYLKKGHITEKWLVESSIIIAGWGFGESLVKVVSLNFFCKWESLKKALLGLRQFSCNKMGN